MTPRTLCNEPIAMLSFESRTEERSLPWLAIAPTLDADAGSRARFTRTLLADGWKPVHLGDTPEITTWSVRIANGTVWLRQAESPYNTGQRSKAFRRLIIEQQALHLVYNPTARPGMAPEKLALSPYAICARVPLLK